MALSLCALSCTTDFGRFRFGDDDAGRDAGMDAALDAAGDGSSDAASDASTDAGTDASTDAGMDASADAGMDAGMDAGAPTCAQGEILFPPSGITTSASLEVRFVLSDSCGAGAPSHVVVELGGAQQAQAWTSGDGSVDQAFGVEPEATLRLIARFASHDVVLDTRTLLRGDTWNFARGIDVNAAGTRAIVVDDQRRAAFSVDLSSGFIDELSSARRGSGPALSGARDVHINSTDTVAYVLDVSSGLLAIDLANGNRTVVSGTSVGTGTAFANPLGFSYDSANDRFLVANESADQLLAVARSTGNRSTLASASVGTGAALTNLYDALVVSNTRALVTSINTGILDVTLPSGNRTVLSGGGASPTVTRPEKLSLDAARGRVLATDDNSSGVIGVSLTDGGRSFAVPAMPSSGVVVGASSPLSRVVGDRVWVQSSSGVIEANVVTGETRLAARNAAGAGPSFHADEIAFDSVTGHLIVAKFNGFVRIDGQQRSTLVDLDPNTHPTNGAKLPRRAREGTLYYAQGTKLYSLDTADAASIHQIPLPTGAGAVNFVIDDVTGSRLLVGLGGKAVVSVALPGEAVTTITDSGTAVSDAGLGSGADLVSVTCGVLDPSGTRLIVGDLAQGAIIEIALDTGNRTTLASAAVGSGSAFTPHDLFWEGSTIYVADGTADAILRVDPTTGDRSELALATGSGPIMEGPTALVVAGGLVFVTDSVLGGILALDPNSGQRILVHN